MNYGYQMATELKITNLAFVPLSDEGVGDDVDTSDDTLEDGDPGDDDDDADDDAGGGGELGAE